CFHRFKRRSRQRSRGRTGRGAGGIQIEQSGFLMILLAMPQSPPPKQLDNVESAIYLVRGQRVMMDSDLAAIYGTSTRRLNERLRRNRERFPIDFAFQLTAEEFKRLMSQIATSKK